MHNEFAHDEIFPSLAQLVKREASNLGSRVRAPRCVYRVVCTKNEARATRTPNRLIWIQTRCHCAVASGAGRPTCYDKTPIVAVTWPPAAPCMIVDAHRTKTVWPSGLRRWLQAPVRKGVGSNHTAVTSVSGFERTPQLSLL